MVKIYIAYLIVSLFLLLFWGRKNYQSIISKFITIVFLPIIGWIIPSVWPKKLVPSKEDYFHEYMENQQKDIEFELSNLINKINIQQELDVISLEEALSISNTDVRRRAMLDVLKGDALKYIDIIKIAIENDDTETSHYAVAAINEMKRELNILLQKLSVQFDENKTNTDFLNTYSNVINEYLLSGFLDTQTIKQYKYTLIFVLEQLVLLQSASEQHFQLKTQVELSLNEITRAENTVQQYKQQFPLSEEAYITAMNVYFEGKSIEKLENEINLLRQSSIVLSSKGLATIRYWMGATKNEQVIYS